MCAIGVCCFIGWSAVIKTVSVKIRKKKANGKDCNKQAQRVRVRKVKSETSLLMFDVERPVINRHLWLSGWGLEI